MAREGASKAPVGGLYGVTIHMMTITLPSTKKGSIGNLTLSFIGTTKIHGGSIGSSGFIGIRLLLWDKMVSWELGIPQLHGIKPQTIPDSHELKLSTHSPDCIWDSSNISLVSPSSGPPFVAGKQSSCVPPSTEGPCVVRSEMIRTL